MYFVAKVKVEFETDNGKVKKVTENYLVEAVSVTDAETIVTAHLSADQRNFEVKSVTESRILGTLTSQNLKNSN